MAEPGLSLEALANEFELVGDFHRLAQKLEPIEGWIHPLEGYALLRLAESVQGEGEIVEIGSWMGLSTCWLALGAQRGGRARVTAVDHFRGSDVNQVGQTFANPVLSEQGTTYHQFLNNLKSVGLENRVRAIVAGSEEAAKTWHRPIHLLFIDGDHSYAASKKDFELWSPFVVEGGWMAFHDINEWPGVTEMYHELMSSNSDYTELIQMKSLRVVRKRPRSKAAP